MEDAAAAPAQWKEVAPGVWSRSFGSVAGTPPLLLLGATPDRRGLETLSSAPFPLPPEAIAFAQVGGRSVVRLPLPPGVPVFGLGLQFVRTDHRGRTRHLRVNSDPKEDTGETHAPVPFYVTGSGYGVLIHTSRIVTLHCASTVRRGDPGLIRDRNRDRDWAATPSASAVEAVVADSGMEVLIFAGPTPLEAVRRYNLYCGGGCLPPRWGLGFWHRTPTRFSDAEVEAEAEEYRRRGFPCDVIGLEPGWHTASYPCTYEWAPDRFPDPPAFVARMRAAGFRINLWEHPWVSPQAPIHQALQPHAGSHTVWGGLAPDYTLPAARAVLEAQHDERHVAAGVSGYKLDECDGSELTGSSWMFPAHAEFPSGRDGEEMRQVYGLLLQQLTAGLFRRRDRRTYGLVRASSTGAAPLPYALYTDLYDHRRFVRALCNAGFAGLLFSPEVRSAHDAEDWVRRMQTVCFSPLAMLNAWSSGTKPWSFPEVEPIVRRYLALRMRLLPYFYTAFARYREDGTPPFRPMALLPGASGELALADDQYMAGEDILVAPLFAGQSERRVLLPPGDWYDFDSGERLAGGGAVTVVRPLEAMPVFVRDGGIVPLMPALPHAPRPGDTVALEVRHYGRRPGRFLLYDDDGETFAFERGGRRWITLEVGLDQAGNRQGRMDSPPGVGGLEYGPVTWRFLGQD